MVGAHRVAYELVNGPIPNGMFVLHSCDNPKCVNHHHLSIGTCAENQRDMQRKGRSTVGDRHPRRVLDSRSVVAIREKAASGSALRDLAVEYGVHAGTIGALVRRETWRHLP